MASKPFEPSNKSSGGKEPEDESRKAMEQSIYGAETALAGRKKNKNYCNSYSRRSCFYFLEFLYASCPFEYKVVHSFHIESSGDSFLFVFFQKVVTLSGRVVFTLRYSILF